MKRYREVGTMQYIRYEGLDTIPQIGACVRDKWVAWLVPDIDVAEARIARY